MKEHIDEMTKVLVDYTKEKHIMASHVILEDYAEQLYNAGYRKQEWISVDERLPERCGYYLGCTYKGAKLIAPFFPVFTDDKPEFDYKISYWMPLPEPPKMKGE